MNRLFIFLLIITIGVPAFSQNTQVKMMPISTTSEKARAINRDAMNAVYKDGDLPKFVKMAQDALKEDPDFFMVNYELAFAYFYFKNEKKFIEYGNYAANCKTKLSNGELLLKEIILKLLENRNSEVIELSKKLINLYPDDIFAYYQLNLFQDLKNDNIGRVETLKNALQKPNMPTIFYNNLGYAYLKLKKYEEAGNAFDKYIELAPNVPNPYDSKGDYFMSTKNYRKAYESYMKAHEIDSSWSYKKAMHAKALADTLEKK
jgi:tetratricopeptide (TPR) repeat protein